MGVSYSSFPIGLKKKEKNAFSAYNYAVSLQRNWFLMTFKAIFRDG